VFKAQLELRDLWAHKELKGCKGSPELRAQQVHKAQLVHKEHWVRKEHKVFKVLMEHKEPQVHKA
jgi:hypothetical protein